MSKLSSRIKYARFIAGLFYKYIVVPVFWVVVFLHFFLLLFSFSTTLTTILVYVVAGIFVFNFISFLETKRSKQYTNIKVMLFSTLLSLLVAELSLRYIVRANLSYSEINGMHLYVSPFFSNKIIRIAGINSKTRDLSFIEHYRVGTKRMESIKDEFSYEHRFNSFGGRGSEPILADSSYKIIALGDSFTEGAGTPEDSTWVHLLSGRIQQIRTDTVTYLNAGVSGSDPFQSYHLLKRLSTKYKPDLAILMINRSDIYDYQNRGGLERFESKKLLNYRWGPWWEPVYAFSFIFRGLVHAFTDLDSFFRTSTQREEGESVAIKAIANLLKNELPAFAKEHDIELWVFSIPSDYELLYHFDRFEEFETLLAGSSVNYVSLKQDIANYLEENDLTVSDIYWEFDRHFKPVGYDIVAQLMYEHIAGRTVSP